MIDIDKLQFEAQNARVTKSLRQHGASSSVFSLYLAMQIDDPHLHDTCLDDDVRDEDAYESMYAEPIQSPQHLRSRLYSVAQDYERHSQYFSGLSRSKDPSTTLHFYNALMPQALHHSSNQIVLPEELINNLRFAIQQKYKSTCTNDFAQTINEFDDSSPLASFFDDIQNARQFAEQI